MTGQWMVGMVMLIGCSVSAVIGFGAGWWGRGQNEYLKRLKSAGPVGRWTQHRVERRVR